jgi:nitric oxide reductase subunit B
MINPPIALYYIQRLNTTPVHGHNAFFGVYGMLGLTLMCLRALEADRQCKERQLAFAFWTMNIRALLAVLAPGFDLCRRAAASCPSPART